jgi:heat shock protein HslJ
MVKLNPIFLLAVVFLLIPLTACNADESGPTSTALPEQSPEVETPETELTTPAVEETSEEVEAEETAEVDAEKTLTPPASGLTAVIASGDSAGVGKPFTFDATQSRVGEAAVVDYVWTLGDGTTLFGISVEHAYSEPGLYTVTLVITDADGQTDTEAKVVEIVDLAEPTTPTAEDQFAIVGTSWKLDNAMRGTAITLAFDEEMLSGSAGCNDYVASHTITLIEGGTSSISISSISTTSDSCTAEVMAQERGYLNSLASARTITVEGNKLIMETGAGTLIFSETSN